SRASSATCAEVLVSPRIGTIATLDRGSRAGRHSSALLRRDGSVSKRQQSPIFFVSRPLSSSVSARPRKPLRILGVGVHSIWGRRGEEGGGSAALLWVAPPGGRGGGACAHYASRLRR